MTKTFYRIKRGGVVLLVSLLLMAAMCLGTVVFAQAEDGDGTEEKPEPVKYAVTMTGDPSSIGNRTAVSTAQGTVVYMEYTVADKLVANQATASIMATPTPEATWPNVGGEIPGKANAAAAPWLAEGAHYKIKFEVMNTDKVSITVDKTVDEQTETLDLSATEETEFSKAYTHYGIFFANGNAYANLRFIDMCFYDGDGNDLGILTNNSAPGKSGSITVTRMDAVPEYADIADEKIVIANANDIFIGNKTAFAAPRKAERVVMEYRVEEATHTYTQNGIGATSTPTAANPFDSTADGASGKLYKSSTTDKVNLLEAGANYKFVFTYQGTNGDFTVKGTKTKGNDVTDIEYTQTAVAGSDYKGYVGIWFSGGECASATLMEARIYTIGGEHKGWQCNDDTEGVFTIVDMNVEEYDEVTLKPVQVEYTVTMNGTDGLYLCADEKFDNKTVGSKVYMDWEVVSFTGASAFGFLLSNTVDATYPYTGAQGTLAQSGDARTTVMMTPGYKYHAQLEVVEGDYKVMVQKIKADDETDVTTVSRYFRTIRTCEGSDTLVVGDHAGMYFWGGTVAGEIKIKIYDEEGNNLGLTQNAGYALGPATVISEPEYSVTYMNGTTDITSEFNVVDKDTQEVTNNYNKFTCGKGLARLPVYTDSENKMYSEGWYSDAACTKKVTGIERMTMQEDIVLYAKMAKYRYNIEFDANNGTGSMDNLVLEYDQSSKLTKNAFTRAGYEFAGWADDNDVKYTDEQTVSGLSNVNGDYIILYAQWTLKNYTITYNLNGGENNADNAATFTVNDVITLKDAVKEGVEFLGWYTTATFEEGTRVTEVRGTQDVTLYARFEEEKTEEPDGGCGCSSNAIGFGSVAGGIALMACAAAITFAKRKKSGENK